MPWGGYNFEDAILISERCVKEDVFTSLHIEEFELQVRDTKRGVEEVTREIPNVGEEALKNLDEDGIIYVGARVRPGDIMVGKVTPKGETELSPGGEAAAGDLRREGRRREGRLAEGASGHGRHRRRGATSSAARTATRGPRRKRSGSWTRCGAGATASASKVDAVRRRAAARDAAWARPRTTSSTPTRARCWSSRAASSPRRPSTSSTSTAIHWGLPLIKDEKKDARVRSIFEAASRERDRIEVEYEKECERALRGDELPPGVVKLVKVYVARRRKLQVGDKMAGRHGNKGVVSKIMAEEDMPYLADGTPVDIVLNPLGVPSRMNLGPDPRDPPRVGGGARRACGS